MIGPLPSRKKPSRNLVKTKFERDHPRTLIAMNNLARSYLAAKKVDQAVVLFEEALKLRKARFPADHPETLTCINNLGAAYNAAGKLDLAVPMLEEALKLTEIKLGPDHPNTLFCMNNLASALWDAKKLEQALPYLRAAGKGVEEAAVQGPRRERLMKNLIGLLEESQLFAEAEEWRRKWLAVVKERSGADSLPYAAELGALGANLLKQQKPTDAERVLREALAVCKQKEPDSWTTYATGSQLGSALLDQKRYAEAEALLVSGYEGLKGREAQLPPKERHRIADSGLSQPSPRPTKHAAHLAGRPPSGG